MCNTKICRVCLSIDRRMCAVTDTVLQEMWEKLTNTHFNTIDGKPLLVCYICCAQLTRSHQLMRRALKAEELLTTFISNGLEQSKELISLMASQLNEFEYNCSIEHQPGVEIIQYEINKEEIKEEKEQEIEIFIKEEDEGSSDSNHEMNSDNDSVSEKDSESDLPLKHMSLKNLLERKVELNFPKVAIGTPARKRKLIEIPQKVKRIKLNATTNDKSIANAVLKIEEASDHEVLDISFSENSLVSNASISERKLTSEQCSQINNISPKLNIRPKANSRTKNEILQGDDGNAENKVFNLPKSESAVTPGTSIDGSDKGNKTDMANMKGPKRYFSCHTCQYKSVKKIEFIRHLLKHTGEKPYMCDVCGYKCALKSSLNVHIKHKHTKEKQYSCALCPYKGATRNALNRHNYKHTGEKPYICDICNHRFTQLGNLKSHINNKHTKEKKFSCYICQRTFFVKSLLDKHLRKHTGEKPYICDLCDFRCSGQGNLKRHKKQKHTKEMNFSCHICQHAFVEKSHLQRHLRNHTGEKPYTCDLCDFRCSDRGYLKRHKMYKHTNERNFSCHICQYKFVVKIDLDRHLRKHTGEKPHTCKICGYKCSYPSGLASHIKSKHSK